jgi:outer membrane protein assembly factor BamE
MPAHCHATKLDQQSPCRISFLSTPLSKPSSMPLLPTIPRTQTSLASTAHRCVTARLARKAWLMVVSSCLLLGGCGSVNSFSFPGVYRIDIPQGNIITQELVDQLRPGLSKRQVTFILGTPLIRDTFDQDRWDYVYSFQPGGGERVQEKLTVYFENDQLVRLGGDFQQTAEKAQFPTTSTSAAPAQPAAPTPAAR